MVVLQEPLPLPTDICQEKATNFANEGHSKSISKFYENSKILITGGTGFVGKALLEKLLRSCEDLDSIYLLMRPKKGKCVDERLEELLQSPVFNIIKDKNPDALKKVKAITGDVSLSGLGITKSDRKFIIQNINIVFHSAATVKFNEELKKAVIFNTLGTERLLQICKKMKHLKSFVHVSTAFSNCDKSEVKEDVYKPIYDPNAILKCIDILPEETVKIFTKRLLGRHPNTYTLTKAMAEYIVSENASSIPSTIVRPSIIIGAWKEPFPGWVDNVSGITGICMECGRGTIRTILAEENCTMELVPIDIVVNTLITSAWYTAQNRTNSVKVINCTSSKLTPIKWEEFRQYTMAHSIRYPSKYVTWYPNFSYRSSRFMHLLCSLFFHSIPSALLDVYLIVMGKKPMMLKISQKFHTALLNGSFFSSNEWNFEVEEMNNLIKAVEHASDGESFELNLKDNGFDWDDYIKNFMLGIRQYVLKDDLSSLAYARKKIQRLFWFRQVLLIFMWFAAPMLLYFLRHIF